MEKMNVSIGHGVANMQTRANPLVVMSIFHPLLVKEQPFLHGFRVTRASKSLESIIL